MPCRPTRSASDYDAFQWKNSTVVKTARIGYHEAKSGSEGSFRTMRKRFALKQLAIVFAAALVASCGAVYQNQRVVAGATGGAKVRVVPVTAQTVMVANRTPYEPRRLPRVFDVTAGMGSGARGAGAVPEPAYTAQQRPTALETRLPPAAAPLPYRIGTGDVVLLASPAGSSVEQLSGLLAAQNSRSGYTVQDDGSIAVPDVGRVEIGGLTLEDAEALLFQRLVKAQIEPTFSLEITQFNSKKVSVGGAVAKPALLPITLTPLYLKEALALTGGSTARDKAYTSVRLYRDGTIYQIPIKTLYDGNGIDRIALRAGDSVFVDDAYQIDQAAAYFDQQIQLANYRQSARRNALENLETEVKLRRAELDEARANYRTQTEFDAVERDYVYLTGEVKTPGRLTLPLGRRANLADALFGKANGLAVSSADPRHIYVLRRSDDPMEFDAMTAWKLDARNAANMSLATRFELRPNDVVFVAEQPVASWGRAINHITPSIINIGTAAIDR